MNAKCWYFHVVLATLIGCGTVPPGDAFPQTARTLELGIELKRLFVVAHDNGVSLQSHNTLNGVLTDLNDRGLLSREYPMSELEHDGWGQEFRLIQLDADKWVIQSGGADRRFSGQNDFAASDDIKLTYQLNERREYLFRIVGGAGSRVSEFSTWGQ